MLQVPVTSRDHSLGSADALVTLVEYGDYECPHCALAHPVTRQLVREFGARLRFVFRNFPLVEVHPMAAPAAEAAEFAGDHDRFWQMHDGIYENQDQLVSSATWTRCRPTSWGACAAGSTARPASSSTGSATRAATTSPGSPPRSRTPPRPPAR